MKVFDFEIPDIILYVVTLPLVPLILSFMLISWLFRKVVDLWLRIKFANYYGGLLSSADKIFTPKFPGNNRIIISVCFIKSYERINLVDVISRYLQKKVFDHREDYMKLTSTYDSLLGQDYLLKNQIILDDVLKTLPLPSKEEEFTEEYLKKYIGSISDSPLPKEDKGLWEIYVAEQPLVKVNSEKDNYIYPVLLRIHHAVGDGIRLVRGFIDVLDGKYETNYFDNLFKLNGNKESPVQQMISHIKNIAYLVYLAIIFPVVYLNISFQKEYERHSLIGQPLSGKKLIAWTITEDGKRFAMVKRIKNRIKGTRFSDVIFTCISASLDNFFKKKNYGAPKDISCLIPIILPKDVSVSSKPNELKNRISFAILDMPIVQSKSFIESLKDIKKSTEVARRNPANNVIYLLNNYISAVIPGRLIRLLQNTRAYTCSISCLPGTSQISVMKHYDVFGIIACAPNTNQTGITFTILTYDEKIHVCVLVDQAIISQQEDAQYIADEVVRNIELLNKQLF